MNTIDLTTHQFANDRGLLRKEVIGIFLNEEPGTGKGVEASKYKYIIRIINGCEIYLSRPAQFNNGFDFTLNVSEINFNIRGGGRPTTRPTHQNILDDLLSKKIENEVLYDSLMKEIANIYNCVTPTRVEFPFKQGYPTEIILECIKWLLVEQDVTYWNYSGRAMFYERIMSI